MGDNYGQYDVFSHHAKKFHTTRGQRKEEITFLWKIATIG
jgi:hypothetical protein